MWDISEISFLLHLKSVLLSVAVTKYPENKQLEWGDVII